MKQGKPYNSIFRQTANWRNLHLYQKSDVLCQLTAVLRCWSHIWVFWSNASSLKAASRSVCTPSAPSIDRSRMPSSLPWSKRTNA